ncbi:MAG TPA: diacylglycerol kinase family protein [Terriglobales bacterium]|nr:diacylglycerol kinase family protein [Terriglobales bacterium]
MKDTLVIVNPASAGGQTGRRWPDVAGRLRAAGLDFDVAPTSCPGDAEQLARQALRDGRSLVVAAGGDGTINEVANGFFEAGEPIATGACLGVLPMGTGGDLRRTLGHPLELEGAAAVLREGRARTIDTGRITCTGFTGGTVVRHFLNIADAGIGGEVVDRVNRGRRLVSGEVTFLLASIRTLLTWRNRPMRVVIDGRARELVAQQVVVANCRFFGGGMCVAPKAVPHDGLFDVVVAGDLGAWENVRGLRRIREGTHLDAGNPKLSHALAERVEISSTQPTRVDADGEQPGVLPALFEVQPGSLRVVCP